jgi:hypothetical protein
MRHDRAAQRSWPRTLSAVAMIAGHVVAPWRSRWRRTWGARPGELVAVWPGDELIAEPTWGYTHAISVDAPPEAVWPWVAQLGQERGGFASFERLAALIELVGFVMGREMLRGLAERAELAHRASGSAPR